MAVFLTTARSGGKTFAERFAPRARTAKTPARAVSTCELITVERGRLTTARSGAKHWERFRADCFAPEHGRQPTTRNGPLALCLSTRTIYTAYTVR